ncbi:MAG TPA: hypothetical protein VIH57_14960 [Bacteroidales bacterium]
MRTSVRVDIPESSPDDMITLAKKALAKHKDLGTASPLNGLDMTTFTSNLTAGEDKRAQAKSLHNQAETLNQQAALNLGIDKSQNAKTPGTVYSTLTSVRDILLGIYKGQEKKLTEWGFDVVISDVNKITGRIPTQNKYISSLPQGPAAEGVGFNLKGIERNEEINNEKIEIIKIQEERRKYGIILS